MFFRRQTKGSILCPSCGNLVGVNDEQCFSCGRQNPAMWGFAGAIRSMGQDFQFVQIVIYGSSFLFLASLILDMGGVQAGGMMLLSPSWPALFLLGGSGAEPVFEFGRWWTVLSAGWLHGGVIHILFNMVWVRNLGPPTVEVYGPGRMVIIYTVSCITGFIFSSVALIFVPVIPVLGQLLGFLGLAGAYRTIGASAPIFGLLGALLYYGRCAGQSAVHRQMLSYAVILGILGIVFPAVDNQAHLGGFVGGYYTARFLDPLKPERVDHLTVALICLGLTVVSIILSIVDGLKYL